jgi:galactokinase
MASGMLASLGGRFETQFGDKQDIQFAMAPGRVNLLGEYTDLNDGFVLPMTVDRGVCLALRKRDDKTVSVYSVLYDELIEYSLDQYQKTEPGSWSSYVFGVVEELRLRGLVSTGFEAVVDGDLDSGAGLSSSAALEVATAIGLQQLTGFSMGPVEMVKLCQHVEHSYANVQCGIMDQFASRLGRKDHALFLDCRSLEYKNIPLVLGDHRIVIVGSGVRRSLAASAYNTRRAECQEAVEYFNRVDGNVTALRDVSTALFEEHSDELQDNVRRRCRHVVAENERVLDAADMLAASRLEEFGLLMSASHNSLRDDFEVSCAELDMLVELANSSDGVLGARMTGAGFGGSTVNLVHKDAIPALTQRLESEYFARFKLMPDIFVLQGNLGAGPLLAT